VTSSRGGYYSKTPTRNSELETLTSMLLSPFIFGFFFGLAKETGIVLVIAI
jgi:hypothetical protein